MKVLMMSTYDAKGGAARAAYRLHQGLKALDVSSTMLVKEKVTSDSSVLGPSTKLGEGIAKTKETLDALPLKLYSDRSKNTFSTQWLPDHSLAHVHKINPDIVNLHWIGGSYLKIESIARFNRPVVWTLQDIWAFTGGCHYAEGCKRFEDRCGACPQLGSKSEVDLSRWVWKRKAKAWKALNLTIVAPSNWMADCARSSSLFKGKRVEVIPFGLDTEIYKPVERTLARNILGLDQGKKVILFGAINATNDYRKGFHLLKAALKNLSSLEDKENITLCIFGAQRSKVLDNLGMHTHFLGHLQDDLSLAIAYSAADVMVVPSIEESFGQTVTESLACGTPVVSFAATGPKDIISHQNDGYLAIPYDTKDLAAGIRWILSDEERHQKLCENARSKVVQNFGLKLQASRYANLFMDILG